MINRNIMKNVADINVYIIDRASSAIRLMSPNMPVGALPYQNSLILLTSDDMVRVRRHEV